MFIDDCLKISSRGNVFKIKNSTSHNILQMKECLANHLHCIYIAGRVAEFDVPARLLEDKYSMFLKLVSEYSTRSGGIPDL